MNTPKKSPSSWILCSSKSFPGKSYNFNVLTGEAVWTLSDHEKNNQKKNTNIQKVNDKLHNYPEPTTHPDNPPEVSTPNIWPTTPTPNHWQDYQRYAQYTPMLNQYMPMPNTVMMPIQWPAPLWPYVAQDAKPPTNDKITQTDRIERNLFVQTSGLPLCQRFINYETPSLNFDKENKVINKCIESPQHKNSNTKIELLESDFAVTQSIPKNILCKNTGCSIQELGEDNNYKGSLPTRSMANLDGTDLRFLLEAKKRKLHEESASIEKTQKHQVPINTKKVRFDLTTANMNCDDDHKKHSNSIPSKESNTKSLHIPLSLPKTHTNDIPQNTTSTATIDMDNALTETGSHIEESDNTTIEIESYVPTRDVSMELNKMYSSNVMNEDNGTGNSYKIKESVTMSERPGLREFSSSYTVKDIWYIVADMNVLLDNYDIVDMILQRYESSRLLIPQRLRAEIDTFCVGDCRGQQRVLVARQISRRIVAAHKQYFLEPPPYKENDKVTTTDGILNCCMRAIKNSYYLVLITNDQCLLTRGRAYNLRCYTVQEIKNGAIINPKSFSELRRLQVTLDNVDIDENKTFIRNKLSDIFSKIDKPIGNKLLAMDSDVKDDKKCDILINITKPKSRNINGNNAENDSVITNDISNQMKVLNITKCIDTSKHSYFSQTEIISENCSINRKSNSLKNRFESQSVSQNFKSSNIHTQSQESNKLIFDNHVQSKSKLDFEKPIFISSNSPSEHINNDIASQNTHSQNEKSTRVYSQSQTRNTSFNIKNTTNTNKMSKYFENHESLERYQNEENIPSQNQNTDPLFENIQNKFQTYFPNVDKDFKSNDTEQNNVSQVKKTHDDKNKITILTTPVGHRLEKIINNTNLKSNIDSPNEENDVTFEVTKVLTLKKGTITSTPKQVTSATDQIRSNFKMSDSCVDDSLKRFYLKNKMMVNNIRSSMDEWICTYTQIMEELLRDVLQLNCEYTNKTIASPITLHETLICIKMLHDNMELKNIITVLVELLTKYSCSKGKLNLDTKPQEFIKIVGCGFLLLKTLKTLYPVSDMFTEYEKYFDTLLSNMECTRTDLDPELLPPMNVCRSEMSQANTDTRLNYRKERSYIVAYLKKHYKEWSAYDENAHRPDTQLKTNNEDIKVLRIIGKNLNMLKIDNNKSISYINSDEKQCSTENDETKIIRLLDNKQTNAKTTNVCIIENKDAVSELRRNVFKEKFLQINDQSSIDAEPKLMKDTDNIDPNINKQDNNKVFIESDVITKPKAMNNDNNIETVKDKEPLDLDMLDFSDVVTVTVDGHSEKSKENYELLSMDIENSDYYNVLNQKHPIDENYATNDDIYASRNDDQREDSIILRSHNKMTTVDKDYATECDLSLKEKRNKIVLENIIIQEDDESVNIQEIYGSRNNIIASNLNYATENRRFDENYANSNIDLSSNDERTMCMDYVTSFEKDVSRVVDENYAKNSINYAICDKNYAKNSENYAIYDGNYKNGEVHAICDGNYAKNGENCADNQMTAQDSKNDSGFENMSAQAYDVIKVFLTVLNVTFKYVYDFISKVVKDLNEKSLCEERKKIVHLKASQCLQEMVAVIKELESIIKRESQEVTTLKKLLLNAGEDAMTDRRATRYRQNVSKYLEQAETLAGALRTVINITVGDTIPSNAGTVCSSERCNNIFE